MERKKRKYSLDEKVNLAKIVAKHKDEYDNFESFFCFVFVFNEYFYRIAIQKLYTYLQIYIKFLLFYGSCCALSKLKIKLELSKIKRKTLKADTTMMLGCIKEGG